MLNIYLENCAISSLQCHVCKELKKTQLFKASVFLLMCILNTTGFALASVYSEFFMICCSVASYLNKRVMSMKCYETVLFIANQEQPVKLLSHATFYPSDCVKHPDMTDLLKVLLWCPIADKQQVSSTNIMRFHFHRADFF